MIATSILQNLKVQFNTYIQVLTTSYFKSKLPILGYPLLDGRQSAPV